MHLSLIHHHHHLHHLYLPVRECIRNISIYCYNGGLQKELVAH